MIYIEFNFYGVYKMKGNFEKSKKFRNLIKSDFNVDVIVSNLKYFIQDDLERHHKENLH